MLGLVLLALSVGLVDSVNPSTVGPALYLAAGPDGNRTVIRFTAGVFAASCAGGCLLVVGPGQAILAAVPHPSQRSTHLLEIGLGCLAFAAAIVLWSLRATVQRHDFVHRSVARRSSFALGTAIVAIEFPTAFPYFAVITADVGSGESVLRQLLPIGVFNAAFVLPLAAIAVLRRLADARSERILETVRREVDRHSAAMIVVVLVVLACALLLVGAVGLA